MQSGIELVLQLATFAVFMTGAYYFIVYRKRQPDRLFHSLRMAGLATIIYGLAIILIDRFA